MIGVPKNFILKVQTAPGLKYAGRETSYSHPLLIRLNYTIDTLPKFNVASESYRNPIGKDRLPVPPFFRGDLLNFGGVTLINLLASFRRAFRSVPRECYCNQQSRILFKKTSMKYIYLSTLNW